MSTPNSKMKNGKCWYIIGKDKVTGEVMNCGEFAGWTKGLPDNAPREYKSFCSKHQKLVYELIITEERSEVRWLK